MWQTEREVTIWTVKKGISYRHIEAVCCTTCNHFSTAAIHIGLISAKLIHIGGPVYGGIPIDDFGGDNRARRFQLPDPFLLGEKRHLASGSGFSPCRHARSGEPSMHVYGGNQERDLSAKQVFLQVGLCRDVHLCDKVVIMGGGDISTHPRMRTACPIYPGYPIITT